jgi:SAM-dependent methyltransferase
LLRVQGADWDARYAAEPTLWGAEPNRFVRERVAGSEPGRAVDLACGNGRNALWLARRGWQVAGVDISGVALEQATKRSAELGSPVVWEQADARSWAPPQPVDLILVAYLHLPVTELIAVLSAAGEHLTPTGRLLYIGHSRTNLTHGFGGPSDPGVLAEIADLAAAAAGLAVRELAHLFRPTEQGDAIDIVLDATPWPPPSAAEVVEKHPGGARVARR